MPRARSGIGAASLGSPVVGDQKLGMFCCLVPCVLLPILTWLANPALADPMPGREEQAGRGSAWSRGPGGQGLLRPHPSGILK